MIDNRSSYGYLPNDTPPPHRLLMLSFQHVLTMFPATVLVALIAGFDVGVVLVGSGIATILALVLSRVISGRFIPLYYGASFSYIAAITMITQAKFGIYAGEEVVRLAQTGIISSGILNIGLGALVSLLGQKSIEQLLSPVISGSIALIIGFSLSGAAIEMAVDNLPIALFTLIITLLSTIYLRGRGIAGLIPIIFGALAGCLASALFGLLDFDVFSQAPWFRFPHFSLPNFDSPLVLNSIISIGVISIATAPESTAHLYQIGLYVDNLAESLSTPKYCLKDLVALNLILDGIGDIANGLIGGLGGTNYGENSSLMAITRNFSGPVLIGASVIAILMGFIGKMAAIVEIIPVAVSGGLALYLFGVIGMQGIAIIKEHQVDLYDPRQLGVGAVVCTLGLGGYIHGDGSLPVIIRGVFPDGIPSVAAAAITGVLLNAVMILIDKLAKSR